jgi:DNA-binding MarR family transcriptional regulator
MRRRNIEKDASLDEFAEKFSRILPFFIREFARRQSSELYRGKITVQQLVALSFLSYSNEKEGAKMSEIAKNLHVTMPAATGVVDRLIREGFALRYNDQNDRRIIRVKITKKGENIVKKIHRQRKEMIRRIFGGLSKEEREGYLRLFVRIGQILKIEKAGEITK